MLLARRLTLQTETDRQALERRTGAHVPFPIGSRLVLVTGRGPAMLWPDEPSQWPPEILALLQQPQPPPLELAGRTWAFTGKPWILGIVNVTPDSFSDGGLHLSPQRAIEHGLSLVEQGAHWLDVGGESTRPGAAAVPTAEELARVLPVIDGLRRHSPTTPLSIDTSKTEVAAAALDAGAELVNDVSAFAAEGMAELVARRGAAGCLMHMQGTPRTMQAAPTYDDVVHEVAEGLSLALERATAAGVSRGRLLVDPGIGFGKALPHNVTLLRHLEALRALGVPVLLGTSRKSFLGALTGQPKADERVVASAATVALAVAGGQVDVVRVHDVRATREAIEVAWAVRTGAE